MPERSAAQGFAALVQALSTTEGVTIGSAGRGFGSDALQVEGRIFAMTRRGGLVLKLPRERVAELVARGEGMPFDAGKGTPMKEWVVLAQRSEPRWLSLAGEALAFVAAVPARGRSGVGAQLTDRHAAGRDGVDSRSQR